MRAARAHPAQQCSHRGDRPHARWVARGGRRRGHHSRHRAFPDARPTTSCGASAARVARGTRAAGGRAAVARLGGTRAGRRRGRRDRGPPRARVRAHLRCTQGTRGPRPAASAFPRGPPARHPHARAGRSVRCTSASHVAAAPRATLQRAHVAVTCTPRQPIADGGPGTALTVRSTGPAWTRGSSGAPPPNAWCRDPTACSES